MVTCDQEEKALSSQKVLLSNFLEIRYLIWRYAELNRLLVGTSLIPLNLELQQDNHTICCGEKWLPFEFICAVHSTVQYIVTINFVWPYPNLLTLHVQYIKN